jgi:MFS family permease
VTDAPDRLSKQGALKLAGRAFGHRNYRLFFAGQGISLIGTWMQQIAMSWLVYRLTGSPSLLGLIGFVTMAPVFFVTSVAGVFVDRWDRRRLLLLTNLLAMIQAAILGVLTLTGHIAVWHIFVLGCCLGFVNAFDMPTRQAFLIDIVERKEDLNNAIALNSTMFNGARLVGPALAGLTVAAFGEGICFLINSLSFLAIIVALLAMRIRPRVKKADAGRPLEGFKEGYRYAFGFLPIRYCVMLVGLMALIGMQHSTLMPVFAKDVLHGGAHTLGFLVSASGTGALLAAFYFASRKTVLGLDRLASIAVGLFGCANLAFCFSRSVTFSLFTMVVSGLGMMSAFLACNTIIQTVVEEDKRGRVMSFHAMASMGTVPFGSLIAGIVASHVGAPHAVFLSAGCCIVGSFFFALKVPSLRAATRPVYVALGIIKEVSAEAPRGATHSLPQRTRTS